MIDVTIENEADIVVAITPADSDGLNAAAVEALMKAFALAGGRRIEAQDLADDSVGADQLQQGSVAESVLDTLVIGLLRGSAKASTLALNDDNHLVGNDNRDQSVIDIDLSAAFESSDGDFNDLSNVPDTASRWPTYGEVTGTKPPTDAEANVDEDLATDGLAYTRNTSYDLTAGHLAGLAFATGATLKRGDRTITVTAVGLSGSATVQVADLLAKPDLTAGTNLLVSNREADAVPFALDGRQLYLTHDGNDVNIADGEIAEQRRFDFATYGYRLKDKADARKDVKDGFADVDLSNRGNVQFSADGDAIKGHVDLPADTGAEEVLASFTGTPAARQADGVTAGIVLNQSVSIDGHAFTVKSIDYEEEHLSILIALDAGTQAAFRPLSIGVRGGDFRETFARAEFSTGDQYNPDFFEWRAPNPMTVGTEVTFDLYEAAGPGNYVAKPTDADDGKFWGVASGEGAWLDAPGLNQTQTDARVRLLAKLRGVGDLPAVGSYAAGSVWFVPGDDAYVVDAASGGQPKRWTALHMVNDLAYDSLPFPAKVPFATNHDGRIQIEQHEVIQAVNRRSRFSALNTHAYVPAPPAQPDGSTQGHSSVLIPSIGRMAYYPTTDHQTALRGRFTFTPQSQYARDFQPTKLIIATAADGTDQQTLALAESNGVYTSEVASSANQIGATQTGSALDRWVNLQNASDNSAFVNPDDVENRYLSLSGFAKELALRSRPQLESIARPSSGWPNSATYVHGASQPIPLRFNAALDDELWFRVGFSGHGTYAIHASRGGYCWSQWIKAQHAKAWQRVASLYNTGGEQYPQRYPNDESADMRHAVNAARAVAHNVMELRARLDGGDYLRFWASDGWARLSSIVVQYTYYPIG